MLSSRRDHAGSRTPSGRLSTVLVRIVIGWIASLLVVPPVLAAGQVRSGESNVLPATVALLDPGSVVGIQNGRFGSRFNLDFRFANHPTSYTCGLIGASPRTLAGTYSGVEGWSKDAAAGLLAAIRVDGGEPRGLPAATGPFPVADQVQTELGLTYQVLRGTSGAVELQLAVVSPFAPSSDPTDAAAKLSSAPLFYLFLTVTNRGTAPARADVLLALGDALVVEPTANGALVRYRASGERGERALFTATGPGIGAGIGPLAARFATAGTVARAIESEPVVPVLPGPSVGPPTGGPSLPGFFGQPAAPPPPVEVRPVGPQGGFSWSLDLPPGGQQSVQAIYAGYSAAPILEDERPGGGPRYFAYTAHFGSVGDVVAYGLAEQTGILEASRRYEERLSRSALDPAARHLVASAVHSYLASTFLLRDRPDPGPPGTLLYTVWEGDCRYHSTVDVAHETGVFEGLVMPWALRMQIENWLANQKRDRYGVTIRHDIGYDTRILADQAYQLLGGDMTVEEIANAIVLSAWYVQRTGDQAFVARHRATLLDLGDSLLARDGSGDGVADRGAYYTTIDLPSALHLAAHNSYVAVKQAAAYLMLADLLDRSGVAGGERYRAAADQIAGTLANAAYGNGEIPTLLPGSDWAVIIAEHRYTTETVGELVLGSQPSAILGDGLLYPLLAGTTHPVLDRLIALVSRSKVASVPYLANGPHAQRLHPDAAESWVSKLIGQQLIDGIAAARRPDLPRADINVLALSGERHGRLGIWGFVDAWSVAEGLPVNLGHYPRGVVGFAFLESALRP